MKAAQSKQAGFVSLIGLLIAVVIVIGLYVLFLDGGGITSHDRETIEMLKETGPTTGAQSLPGAAIERGRSVGCDSNVRQLQQAVGMFQMDQERFPASLQELQQSNYTGGMPLTCPVTGEAYGYDSQTGQVWCPTHSR